MCGAVKDDHCLNLPPNYVCGDRRLCCQTAEHETFVFVCMSVSERRVRGSLYAQVLK